MSNYGTIQIKGVECDITQRPHIDKRCGESSAYYSIVAVGDEKYEIKWRIINHACDDESDACDWDDYTVRQL